MAHTEMPTTLEAAEDAIKKQEDFMTTMDVNEEKIKTAVETGQRLVSDGNIYSDRIQERVGSVSERYFRRSVKPFLTAPMYLEPETFLSKCSLGKMYSAKGTYVP